MDILESFPRVMGSKSYHALKLMEHLYDQMCAQSEFCDITLVAGGIEMRAHWCVLVSCPYFQSLYDSGMKEKQDGKITISVGKPVAVRKAISFLYTGNIEISYDDVKDILEVADYLQIDDLKTSCTCYLSSVEITTQNCVSLCLLASLYDLDIYTKVFEYMRGHLPEVMLQSDTLSLTADSVLTILQDPSLNYISVEEFFDFIVKWAQHDLESRTSQFENLFCELDLKKMSRNFLEKTVESVRLVVDSDKCKVHVLNVKMKHMAGLLQDESTADVILLVGGMVCSVGQHLSNFFTSPFSPLSEMILVDHIYGYIIKEDRWTELAPLPYKMRRPYVAYKGSSSCLYVYDNSSYGAGPGSGETIGIFQYNIMDKVWTSPRFPVPDGVHEVTVENMFVCNNCLYFLASGTFQQDNTPFSGWTTFIFTVSDDWSHSSVIAKLFQRAARTQLSSCVVSDRYICVLGYKCGSKVVNSRGKNIKFLYIDSRTNKKTESSRIMLHDTLLIPYKDQLFLAKPGSYKHARFNFQTKRWSNVKELFISNPAEEGARTDFIYTVFMDQVFMFGGKSAATCRLIDNACYFDLNTKVWRTVAALPKAMSHTGIVAAKLPKEHVRCHIDCPHCKYQAARLQASYQIQYPIDDDDEDDDDDDMSYEDEDIYSDFWDDHDYNLAYDWF